MANSLGTLAGSLILQRGLELVFTVRPLLKNIALNLRDLDSGAVDAKLSQTVITRTFSVPTVNNFGTGAGDTADTDVSVTLNQHKEVHYAFTPAQYGATDRQLIDEHAYPMAVALANGIIDAIAANWTAANFANSTVKAGGWDYDHLATVRQALQDRGVPMGQRRFYVGSTGVYKSLLSDTLIVAALNNPANGRAIESGMLPTVLGIATDEYPAITGIGGNLVGFCGTPDSVVYAQRVLRNPEELFGGNVNFPGNLGVITEPRTGLSVLVTQWIDPSTLNANTRLSWIYGSAVGNSNNGQRIITA